jgi:hypothetical protein
METSGSQPSLRLVGSRIPVRTEAEPPAPLPIGEYEECRRDPGTDPRLDALESLEGISRKIDDLARLLLGDDDTPRAA